MAREGLQVEPLQSLQPKHVFRHVVPRSRPPISVGGATQLSRDMTKVAKGIVGRARASFSLCSSSASGEVGPFPVWGSYLGLPIPVPLSSSWQFTISGFGLFVFMWHFKSCLESRVRAKAGLGEGCVKALQINLGRLIH